MGILNIIIDTFQTINKPVKSNSRTYKLIDDKGRQVDMFSINNGNFSCVNLYIKTRQHCIVQSIDPVKEGNLYIVKALDELGQLRKFKMKYLYYKN